MTPQQILLAALVLVGTASPAFAQSTSPTTPPGKAAGTERRGGLLPQRSPTPAIEPMSRAELMRRFDRNSDGKIDEVEAEMARSRMRRDRVEMLHKSSIDPLTGRPRGAPPPEPQEKPADLRAADVVRPDPKPKDDELLLVPGNPDGARPSQAPAAKTQTPTGRPSTSAARSPLPPRQPPENATGGVRAGAPAARPGYGALGPKPTLNAGRQPTVPSSGMQPRVGGMPPRGMPGRAAPPTARPARPPRITAEDIGQ